MDRVKVDQTIRELLATMMTIVQELFIIHTTQQLTMINLILRTEVTVTIISVSSKDCVCLMKYGNFNFLYKSRN